MDSSAWLALLFGILVLIVMCLIALTAHLGSLLGRYGPRQRDDEPRDRAHRIRTIRDLLDAQRAWIAALDVATVLAGAVATGLLASGFGHAFGRQGTTVAVIVVVAVYLILAQSLPIALSRSRPALSTRWLGVLAAPLGLLFRPAAVLVRFVAQLLDRVIPNAPDEQPVDGGEDELRSFIAPDEDSVIQPVEREMIDGILQLEEVRARELMVPRVDIVAIDRTTPGREIVDLIIRAGHSRIPVYQESIDNVIGVLYAKDLLPFVIGTTEALPLVSLLRKAYVVPETKRVNELLTELREQRVHLAIVADEYGGTAGIITIEDILEEIVGEIQDEYDKDVPLFHIVSPDSFIADGRLAVEDAEDVLGVQFEDDDYGSLGGFVQKHLGRLPLEGDEFDAEGVRVTVLEVERHRIRRMLIRRLDESGGELAEPPALPETVGPDPEPTTDSNADAAGRSER